MVNEGLPAILWKNPETGKLELRRQLALWGTGTAKSGGGAFEELWNKIMGLWQIGKYDVGIIPIFFDWTTRCTPQEYEEQKIKYYGKTSKSNSTTTSRSIQQFHQHYPSTPDDMFVTTAQTLVSREFINTNISRIRNSSDKFKCQHGYFEPIFDFNSPENERSDVPYKIIGAEWIPTDDFDPRITATIFQHPKKDWMYRYYQGTDPIASDTGASKMASAIWDKQYNTVSAIVNLREQHNPKYCYLQCMLLGLYYDTNKTTDVKELLEANIGLAYANYKELKGYWHSMLVNSELPPSLQSGNGSSVGVDNKGTRNRVIINYMTELFTSFGERIYIDTPFEQLKTFVCNITRSGNETWGSLDKKFYDDDVLFAVTYAYISAISKITLLPIEKSKDIIKNKYSYELKYDKNWNLTRAMVSARV